MFSSFIKKHKLQPKMIIWKLFLSVTVLWRRNNCTLLMDFSVLELESLLMQNTFVLEFQCEKSEPEVSMEDKSNKSWFSLIKKDCL